ncbi:MULTISPECIES: extracellular solute-binding protein [Dictyoglomus]|jgi:multiple sugar transport system substrate-binding protein|uniref:Extracellular solute-binding protein family 1 n=1 Tax=Dictyoglomus turgidum (strain DSM 6724 / Z-1310) TaxID=515635 RepID=B8E202_DICTD|nr:MULTISPECIES: extracellular solute-binding protein [Dictyoglomus]ACK41785.1 extracellular solute-binding protein family 1 [Dictyoglomus turgidum DSM 6724]HBU31370.1 ABC transporter substrate-binding protein [Dictyoglomus sp.]
MRNKIGFLLISLILILSFVLAQATPYKTTINVLVWDDAHTKAVKSLIPEFEKVTGIKVNFVALPTRSVLEKAAVGISLDRTDYDLVAVDEPFVPQFGELLIPYTLWPKGRVFEKVDLKDIVEGAVNAAIWEGTPRGLPINGNVYVYIYRKDLFEDPKNKEEFKKEYGYELNPPNTFKELLDVSRFFSKKPNMYGFGPFTIKAEGVTAEAVFIMSSFGTDILKASGKTVRLVLDKKKAVEAIKFYKDLLETAPPGKLSFGHTERIQAFNMGQIAVMFQWPALIPNHEDPKQSLVAGKIGYIVPPAGPARRVAVTGCWILGIPKASKNKTAAAEFAYWWASKEAGKKLIEAGMSPVRKDLLSDPDLQKTRKWYQATLEAFKYGISRPRFKDYAKVSEVIQVYWTKGISGELTPEQAVDSMYNEIYKILKEGGYVQ